VVLVQLISVLFDDPGLSAYSGFCFGGSGSAALWGGSGSGWCDSGLAIRIGGGSNVVPVGVVLVRRLECSGFWSCSANFVALNGFFK